MISKGLRNATFLTEYQDGRMHLTLPDGQENVKSGAHPFLANHFPAQANGKGQGTSGTCGQNSIGSLENVDLSQSLGNRLKERLGLGGSMEYSQTWKLKITPAGRQYWAHIASTRRISGKDCTGWPTPNTMDTIDRDGMRPSRAATGRTTGYLSEAVASYAAPAGWPTPMANKLTPQTREDFTPNLAAVAMLAGRPTPQEDNANNARGHKGTCYNDLPTTAQMAGWATPTEYEDRRTIETYQKTSRTMERADLSIQVRSLISGQTPSGYPAKTGKPAGLVLNPNHSRWLMGYRAEWLCLEVLEMLSSPKRQRNS